MFGLLKGGCLDRAHRTDWMAHYCGLCVSLSLNFGSISRIFTNSDAVLVSLLYSAQCEQDITKSYHWCFLRKRRKIPIVSPGSLGSRYAAIISSLIASSKIIDNIADGDSWFKYFSRLFFKIETNFNRRAAYLSSEINVDTKSISEQVFKQIKLEQEKGLDFLSYSQPIEIATSMACATTAELSASPQNREPLAVVGRMYGRIIYLLDSYRDYLTDIKNNSFNPLAQKTSEAGIQKKAEELFNAAYAELKDSLSRVQFAHPNICATLLGDNLSKVATNIFHASNNSPEENHRERWWHSLTDGCDCCDCFCNFADCFDSDRCNISCDCCHSSSCDGCHCCGDGCSCDCS